MKPSLTNIWRCVTKKSKVSETSSGFPSSSSRKMGASFEDCNAVPTHSARPLLWPFWSWLHDWYKPYRSHYLFNEFGCNSFFHFGFNPSGRFYMTVRLLSVLIIQMRKISVEFGDWRCPFIDFVWFVEHERCRVLLKQHMTSFLRDRVWEGPDRDRGDGAGGPNRPIFAKVLPERTKLSERYNQTDWIRSYLNQIESHWSKLIDPESFFLWWLLLDVPLIGDLISIFKVNTCVDWCTL